MDMKRDFLAEYSGECLYHHGIIGQKWGVRRFQNKDGSLTEAGRKRYLNESGDLNDKGKKRFLSRDDGTYYDLTKYSRKLGALGGIIDTARYAKEMKEQKTAKNRIKEVDKKNDSDTESKTQISEARNAFDNEMTRTGWKTGAHGFSEWSAKNGKMGDKDVEFIAQFDPEYNKQNPQVVAKSMNQTQERFQKEYKKVLSTAREAIAKEYYDTGSFNRWNDDPESPYYGLSRDQFKKELPLSSVIFRPLNDGKVDAELYFNDGKDMKYLMGDHCFTMEYDIDADEPRYVSMQG